MNNDQLAKVRAKLIALGYKESAMNPKWFFTEDGTNRAADLRKENPIIGILISGNIVTSGHGNLKVEDDIQEVEAIVKSKTIPKSQSSVSEQAQKQPAGAGGRETNLTKEETKLGAGDNAKIPVCRMCGIEVSHARALACLGNNEPCTCEACGQENNGGTKMNEDTEENLRQSDMEVLNQKKDNLPAKKKQEFVVGTCEAVAVQYGIPAELTKLFFMTMDGGLYIKNPGLLYLAGKKGYSRIEATTSFDEKAQEWSAECKIYPKLTKDILEGISHLDKELQKIAFDFATQPTNGTGRASKASVRMSTMHPFLKEMAQTRAQNRCLRAFTSYGGTSAEELPDAQLERD